MSLLNPWKQAIQRQIQAICNSEHAHKADPLLYGVFNTLKDMSCAWVYWLVAVHMPHFSGHVQPYDTSSDGRFCVQDVI